MKLVSIGVPSVATIVCFVLATAAHAAEWTLTTADFQKQSVQVRSLDENGLTFVSQGGVEPVKLPIDQFLSLNRNDARPFRAPENAFVLHRVGGGRLIGQPLRIEGDDIVWQTQSIGQFRVSLRMAEGITKGDQPLPPPQEAAQDRVRLVNGDALDGIVVEVTQDNLVIQVGTDPVPVPLASIATVRFAVAGRQPASDQPGYQLRLPDGTTLFSPRIQVQADQVQVDLAGETRQVALADVTAIEQVNGPVVWLSDRQPDQAVQTPFLGDPVAARFNTNLDGRPLRIGEERISKAIAVHSRSELTWQLPEGFARFRTRYAIDGDLPQANVTVRILLDDKVVHERADVIAGGSSAAVEIDLDGARRLTLQADYGRTYDVQDRLVWIEPALIK